MYRELNHTIYIVAPRLHSAMWERTHHFPQLTTNIFAFFASQRERIPTEGRPAFRSALSPFFRSNGPVFHSGLLLRILFCLLISCFKASLPERAKTFRTLCLTQLYLLSFLLLFCCHAMVFTVSGATSLTKRVATQHGSVNFLSYKFRRASFGAIFPKDVPNFKQLVHPNNAIKGVAFCGEFWGWVWWKYSFLVGEPVPGITFDPEQDAEVSSLKFLSICTPFFRLLASKLTSSLPLQVSSEDLSKQLQQAVLESAFVVCNARSFERLSPYVFINAADCATSLYHLFATHLALSADPAEQRRAVSVFFSTIRDLLPHRRRNVSQTHRSVTSWQADFTVHTAEDGNFQLWEGTLALHTALPHPDATFIISINGSVSAYQPSSALVLGVPLVLFKNRYGGTYLSTRCLPISSDADAALVVPKSLRSEFQRNQESLIPTVNLAQHADALTAVNHTQPLFTSLLPALNSLDEIPQQPSVTPHLEVTVCCPATAPTFPQLKWLNRPSIGYQWFDLTYNQMRDVALTDQVIYTLRLSRDLFHVWVDQPSVDLQTAQGGFGEIVANPRTIEAIPTFLKELKLPESTVAWLEYPPMLLGWWLLTGQTANLLVKLQGVAEHWVSLQGAEKKGEPLSQLNQLLALCGAAGWLIEALRKLPAKVNFASMEVGCVPKLRIQPSFGTDQVRILVLSRRQRVRLPADKRLLQVPAGELLTAVCLSLHANWQAALLEQAGIKKMQLVCLSGFLLAEQGSEQVRSLVESAAVQVTQADWLQSYVGDASWLDDLRSKG